MGQKAKRVGDIIGHAAVAGVGDGSLASAGIVINIDNPAVVQEVADDDTGATKIVYATEEYTWDNSLTNRGSRWVNEDNETLVSEVTTQATDDLDYSSASAGDVCKAVVKLTVDGARFCPAMCFLPMTKNRI